MGGACTTTMGVRLIETQTAKQFSLTRFPWGAHEHNSHATSTEFLSLLNYPRHAGVSSTRLPVDACAVDLRLERGLQMGARR